MIKSLQLYLEFTRKSFQRSAAYRLDAWTRVVGNLFSLGIWACIWYALYYGKEAVENVSFHSMLSYILISMALQGIHNAGTPLWEIQHRVRSGDIAIELLRPYDYPLRMLFTDLGSMAFYFITAVLPLFTVIFLVLKPQMPASASVWALFILSAVLGYLIRYSLELTFGLFTFWLVETGGVEDVFYFSISLFSGSVVPLWFFPEWLGKFASFLPFQGIYFVPNSIFVGELSGEAVLPALLTQCFWLVVCYGLLRFVWSRASMKIVVQGG